MIETNSVLDALIKVLFAQIPGHQPVCVYIASVCANTTHKKDRPANTYGFCHFLVGGVFMKIFLFETFHVVVKAQTVQRWKKRKLMSEMPK